MVQISSLLLNINCIFNIIRNGIILIIVCSLILYFKSKNKIINYIGKHKKKSIFFLGLVVLIFIFFLLYSSKQKELSFLYLLNIGLTLIVLLLALIEFEKKDSYMLNYLILSFIYIEIVCICCSFQQDNLKKFITTSVDNKIIIKIKVNKIIINEINANKNNVNKIFAFLSLLLLFMILGWITYYVIIRDVENEIQNIDKIELKIIFLKSILQSITASIALLGLTGWGLGKENLIAVLFIDAYAAFSYPILDINKYVRQKELEQRNKKMCFDNYNY